jgi:hypothetical protein
MKPYLRLSSLLLILIAGCASPYKHLQPLETPQNSAFIYKPQFNKALYRCIVNGNLIFKKFHLSGILLFKTMENGTVRAVFQNEMGMTFFDFEWDGQDSFKVNQVIEQLDRPAVVKTLKKDLSLLLMKGLDKKSEKFFVGDRGKSTHHCFNIESGYAYYVETGKQLVRIENAGEKKKVITITTTGRNAPTDMPDSVFFNHHKANFTIALQKIQTHSDE